MSQNKIKDKITKAMKDALRQAFSLEEEKIPLERPKDDKFGEYACTISLSLSKRLKKNPREIGEKILEKFTVFPEIETPQIAGPGFINFKLSNVFWNSLLDEILESGNKYGRGEAKKKKINIEFISCNPTGPMTIANGRGGFAGDALASLLAFLGYTVEREFYVNDTGNQVLTLGKSALAIRGKIKREDDFYRGQYLEELEKKIPQEEDPALLGKKIADEIMKTHIKDSIIKMQISFDNFFSERKMRQAGKIEKMLEFLEKNSLTYEKENALFMKTSTFGDDKDRVLRKSNGEFTYFASDITYHLDKFSRSDNLINIWGADHHGYIGRILAFASSIEREKDISFLIMQLVRLVSEGKEVKMSKRTGSFIEMKDLIDEVGHDSARWFFLEKAANTHLDFDFDLAKDRSEKNPAYYVKYAHARLCGILRKLSEEESHETSESYRSDFSQVEISLLRELEKFPSTLEEIGHSLEIHKICFLARSLAEKFHSFYAKCPVLKASLEERERRERMLRASKIVLASILEIIGIEAPERM